MLAHVLKSGSVFAQNDSIEYAYNEKSELTNAVAVVDSNYRYVYDFDDIGNRETSSERGMNSVYAANQLNQYTEISNSALSASSRENFTPQFDDDGNSILPDGTIPAGSWKSHVSQRGTFFGYSGLVNWISQFWLEESINEE